MITSSEGLKTSSLQHLDDTSQLRPPEDPWPMSVSDGLGGHLDWAKAGRKGEAFINQRLTIQKMSFRSALWTTGSLITESASWNWKPEKWGTRDLSSSGTTSITLSLFYTKFLIRSIQGSMFLLRWNIQFRHKCSQVRHNCDKWRIFHLTSSFPSYKLSQCGEERDTVMLCSDASNQPWR